MDSRHPEVDRERRILSLRVATLLRGELRRRERLGVVGSVSERRPAVGILRTIGRVAFTALFGILIAVTVVLGIGGIVSLGEPVHWGTFTEERCDRARFGCRSIGTWVSDDGTIRVEEVQLDGAPEPDGTQRAAYRPTGFNNDADNAIVHAEPWATLGPWMPLGLALFFGGVLTIQWWQWRQAPARPSARG